MELDPDPASVPQPLSPLRFKPISEHYCCCLPVTSGVWVLSLTLIIPSLALALCFNVADLQGFIQFNSPAQVKVFYTVVYALYTLLGLAAAAVLPRMAIDRRLKTLIFFYWILITATVIEGVYFGIMMSKQKLKLVSYCGNGDSGTSTVPAISIPSTGNGTSPGIGASASVKDPHPIICHKTHALVGVFYILGPGGWIILHSVWILIVALYSKALRRLHPADEELATVMMARRSIQDHVVKKTEFPRPVTAVFSSNRKYREADIKGKSTDDIEMKSGIHLHQHHPFQHDIPFNEANHQRSSSGLGTMLRSIKPWPSSEQVRRQSGSLQHIDEDDDRSIKSDESEHGHDADNSEDGSASGRASDGPMSSRTDIPADGKGWWIRQIEGKRRGEICPCTMDQHESQEHGSCWCGKQRRTSQNKVLNSEASSEAGPSGTNQRSLNSQSSLAT
ncbi:hypothetical protein BGZ58_007615 [Dissophora ornata]|nr:hypothetical protein BGZ58_007615 [Dissophora ornata]